MRDAKKTDPYVESFNPREYLRQYYSLPELAADDAALFRHLTGWLHRTGRVFESAVDIGCGPTIHNTFAIAPFVQRISLADYLPGNLAEVQRWRESASDAHNWDPLFSGILANSPPTSGGSNDGKTLEERKALFRSRIVALRHCDLSAPLPLGAPDSFDLVTSFFCPECVASSKDEWHEIMTKVLALVAPGGAVYFAAVRDCRGYSVLGRWFPATPINEHDFKELLLTKGFRASTVAAVAVPAPDWEADGFKHIVLAHGEKS